MNDAFFRPRDGRPGFPGPGRPQVFAASEACVGPWSADAMHGGPPSALLVRQCEHTCREETGFELVALRASLDFLSPVPVGEVDVRSRLIRTGRRVSLAEGTLSAGGKEVMHARIWMLRSTSDDAPVRAQEVARVTADPIGRPPEMRHPRPADCPPAMTDWAFPYARAIEWRHVSGDPGGPGDAAAWARQRLPLIGGETPSGSQRAVLVADSGNGISASLDWDRWSFANVDLTVHLSRPLVDEWVLLDARTRYEPGGTGLATSVLHDVNGVVGTGAQTLLISRLAGTR